MRSLSLLLIALCWITQAHAFDVTTQGVVASVYVTSQLTTTPFENKRVIAARDDAAVFIASDGQQRGVQLESALAYLRQTQAKLHASDLELAQAILVQ